jgi:hypothetical protein
MILCSLGFGVVTFVGIDHDEAQVGDVAVEITHNLYTRSSLVEIEKWNEGMGVNLSTTEAISLHFIPCIEFHLQFLKGSVVYLEYETFGFPKFLLHLTTLSYCTSLVWKTCFKMEITFLGWSTMDQKLIISWKIW